MTLHFSFIFFNFRHIVIIQVVLVRLIVTFDHKVTTSVTIVIAVIACLLLHQPFLLFTYKLILPNKRWRLFLGSCIAKFNLINFSKYVLGSLVYT